MRLEARRHGPRAAALFFLAATLAAVHAADGSPRLRVEPSEVDLGDLTRADPAEARFEIHNDGSADLRILAANPSCGCTVVSFDPVIPPGGVGHLEAVIDTTTVLGSVWNQIHVESNDPERPKLALDLRARVFGAVGVLPVSDVFLHNRAGRLASTSRLLRKEPDEDGEFEVAELETSAEWLKAWAEKIDEEREAGAGLPEALPGDWILRVAVTGEPAYGRSEETIRFSTGLPREPVAVVPVVLDLRPPVNLSTESVTLSSLKQAETIVVSVREGGDPAELEAEARPEALKIDLQSMGGRYFKLYVFGTDAIAPDGGSIVFRLGNERMTVPVHWSGGGR